MYFNTRHELIALCDVKKICVGIAELVLAFVDIQCAEVGSHKHDLIFKKPLGHTICLNDLMIADLGQREWGTIVVDPGILHFFEDGG